MGRRRHVNTITSSKLVQSFSDQTSKPDNYVEKGSEEFTLEKKHDESGDIIILRNGSEAVDIPLEAVRRKLQSLYEVRNVRISQLSEIDKKKLMNIGAIMQGLRNTSFYSEIVALIDEVFFRNTNVILPGTVGAHFNGCKVKTNFTPFACSPICSGSIQPIDMGDGWSVCDKYTILYDIKERRFTTMNNPVDKEHAFIFISSNEKFLGFSNSEKESLANLGIKHVKIVSYDNTGKNTVDITNDFVELAKVKSKEIENVTSYNSWYIFFWVLIVIIILLIVAMLIYLLVVSFKKKKNNNAILDEMLSDGFSELPRRTPNSRIAKSMTSSLS